MKEKILSIFALLLIAVVGARADGTVATFSWEVGNEEAATITSDAATSVSATSVSVGAGLTVSPATYFNVPMVRYRPSTSDAGSSDEVMIEYSIIMNNGCTFNLSGLTYNAVKVATDGMSYTWSYTVDGVESTITEVPKEDILRNNGSNSSTAQQSHSETISATAGSTVTVRFYASGVPNNKDLVLGTVKLTGVITTAPAGPPTYTVAVKEDTEDAENWTIDPATAEEGQTVTVTYNGTRRIKSITAVVEPASPAAPVTDLSLLDCAGNERTDGQWTANCYMVHTAGDYKLPLVYGNAIKSGEVNEAAYTGVTGNDDATATFPRHDGNAITDPWIKDNGITVASAELLWQDAEGLVTAVDISGDYLTLTVGKNASEQEGNALVAAKDGNGNIVWSWHIWVTKQTFADLTTIATGSHDYQVTPVNLGWVTTGGDGKQGYHTYYQWGRKDAFIPGTGTSNTTNHTVYDISGGTVANAINYSTFSVGIDGNIRNPTTFYYVSDKPNNTTFYNLWDAQQTGTGNITTATKKTVYDPCPAGFCVPTGNLYYYMGNGGNRRDTNWDNTNKGKTWTSGDENLYLPASGLRSFSSGSLGSVGSNGFCWSASADSRSYSNFLSFTSSYWYWNSSYRAYGLPVRAVAEE